MPARAAVNRVHGAGIRTTRAADIMRDGVESRKFGGFPGFMVVWAILNTTMTGWGPTYGR